jgi:hypothetical protein
MTDKAWGWLATIAAIVCGQPWLAALIIFLLITW